MRKSVRKIKFSGIFLKGEFHKIYITLKGEIEDAEFLFLVAKVTLDIARIKRSVRN